VVPFDTDAVKRSVTLLREAGRCCAVCRSSDDTALLDAEHETAVVTALHGLLNGS